MAILTHRSYNSTNLKKLCEKTIPKEILDKLKKENTHTFLFFKTIDWELVYFDWTYSKEYKEMLGELIKK